MKTKFLALVMAAFAFAACTKEDPNDPCIDKSKINEKIGCFEIYDPVCGCDGKTYPNACYAEHYNGLKSWKKGPCPGDEPHDDCIDPSKIDPQVICNYNYDPVCGCNGVTYSNQCEAEKNGVLKWQRGGCTVDTTKMDCIEVCKDSCLTLKAPMVITTHEYRPDKPQYTYRWNPASNNPNNYIYTVCPTEDMTVYLEMYITECRTPIVALGCGNGKPTVTQTTGIMPGGCVVIGPPNQMVTRLVSVKEYCIKVKECHSNGI